MKQAESENLWGLVRGKVPMKLLSVAVSAAILFLLYRKLDHHAIRDVFSSADGMWLFLSVGMIVPITLLNAVRFRWVATLGDAPPYTDAIALTVISNALNLFLPAKLGDLAKSHFLYTQLGASGGVAVSVVVFERLCDVFAVATWCLLGRLSGLSGVNIDAVALPALFLWLLSGALLLSGGMASDLLEKIGRMSPFRKREKLTLLVMGWPDLLAAMGRRSYGLAFFSLGIWFLHLTQLWMFTLAVGAEVPFLACLAISPVVLLCSLVPFTLGGIGPRDAASLYLFAAYMAPPVALAVGILTISRSVVPALAALPFLRRYLRILFEEPSIPTGR